MYNYMTHTGIIAFLLFIIGLIVGWALGSLDHEIGFNKGWHKGVEDTLTVIKGEINANDNESGN